MTELETKKLDNEDEYEYVDEDDDKETIVDDDHTSKSDDDEEAEENTEEKGENDPEVPITMETMADCLSLLCKTGDGLAHAYVRFDAPDRELTDISSLTSYVHLRYIDLSGNKLRDVSALNSLSHLISIQLSHNKLTSASVPTNLTYLQTASFSDNRIQSVTGISHPALESLNLNYNEITLVNGLESDKLCRLHTLELRGNRLTSISGLRLPSLKNLYLAANEITSIGETELENLTVLHIRENQIQTLDGFSANLKHLEYLNLRANVIADIKETKKLHQLPALKSLVLSENPIADDNDYRLEVLVEVDQLDRLDKDKFIDEDKEEAARIRNERRQEEMLLAQEDAEAKEDMTEDISAENVSTPVAEE